MLQFYRTEAPIVQTNLGTRPPAPGMVLTPAPPATPLALTPGSVTSATVDLTGLDAIDWTHLEHAHGSADDVPGLIRALAWFYDNLGVFVVHKLIDVPMVAGYLGGSVIDVWEKLMPLIEAERLNRAAAGRADHERWLEYFEYLYNVVVDDKPGNAGAAKVRARIKRQVNRAKLRRGGEPRRR